MSNKPDDFERACAAYAVEFDHVAATELSPNVCHRRGMLAALKDIVDRYHATMRGDKDPVVCQAMREELGELIRQGEQQEVAFVPDFGGLFGRCRPSDNHSIEVVVVEDGNAGLRLHLSVSSLVSG